jgi:hypothetical protein
MLGEDNRMPFDALLPSCSMDLSMATCTLAVFERVEVLRNASRKHIRGIRKIDVVLRPKSRCCAAPTPTVIKPRDVARGVLASSPPSSVDDDAAFDLLFDDKDSGGDVPGSCSLAASAPARCSRRDHPRFDTLDRVPRAAAIRGPCVLVGQACRPGQHRSPVAVHPRVVPTSL